ncbi:SRPBCC family protein, partial [Mycobacterium sp.]|uniref:SRPBCC family protein n=1 Tax=Mycobacterium sp. TaxID=1785 RepID=UPI003C78C662
MAVTERREVVIEATPDEILDVLFDIESLPEWSSVHQQVDVLERDDRGRPSKSRQVVKIVGVSDEQVLAYSVHDDGVSWTLVSAKQQRAQDGRYTLTPEGDSTRVRLDLTVDLFMP